ncbi:LysR family transcriptional regulator [Pseudoalteromonas rubra]|uniref:LysR family transcriptional regulator n=1 Tax=Pseudoalteromonas rubra TaxID=43658 RepID=A0A5S3WKF7_9GAMM|nr:LysR family transcriptional regulator [Pseudoalteromonas rubra]TMP26938.1 LysR family transcriptional regulator [Pseudoalteromonas rubra]TMP27656.1 LysR family transcriptional regulator [Pseudoalteromonas rubra]
MLRVTLEQWRMLRAVVEHGGFNQAAKAIHKSQSSIHTSVQKIETSLSVKLFQVEGRKTRLTEAGEMMLRRANYLLDEAEKVEAVGQTLAKGVESHLRIAVDEIFPQTLLYKVLEATSQAYPLLRIELVESILSGSFEALQHAKVDIAISPMVLTDGFSEQLCQVEFVAVAHPEHALHQLDRELTLEDLKSFRQIVVRDSALGKGTDSGWLGADQRWTVSHLRTMVDMVTQGLGFAWLPRSAITQQLSSGALLPLKLTHNRTRLAQLNLIFKDGDTLGPAARAFIGELRYQCMALEAQESI